MSGERREGSLTIPKWFIVLIAILGTVASGIVGATLAASNIQHRVTENASAIAGNTAQLVAVQSRVTVLEERRAREVLIDYRLCRIEVALKIRSSTDACTT